MKKRQRQSARETIDYPDEVQSSVIVKLPPTALPSKRTHLTLDEMMSCACESKAANAKTMDEFNTTMSLRLKDTVGFAQRYSGANGGVPLTVGDFSSARGAILEMENMLRYARKTVDLMENDGQPTGPAISWRITDVTQDPKTIPQTTTRLTVNAVANVTILDRDRLVLIKRIRKLEHLTHLTLVERLLNISPLIPSRITHLTIDGGNMVDTTILAKLPATLEVIHLNSWCIWFKGMVSKFSADAPVSLKEVRIFDGVGRPGESGFNRPLSELNIPDTVESLIVETKFFDQSLNGLPPNLLTLILGDGFNHTLNGLPQRLLTLILGDGFNQTLDGVPDSVNGIRVGNKFNQVITKLPTNLTDLNLGDKFSSHIAAPCPNLKRLTIGKSFTAKTQLPDTITYLKSTADLSSYAVDVKHQTIELPPKLEELYLPNTRMYPKKKDIFYYPLCFRTLEAADMGRELVEPRGPTVDHEAVEHCDVPAGHQTTEPHDATEDHETVELDEGSDNEEMDETTPEEIESTDSTQ